VFDADPAGSGTGNAVQARDARTGALLWSRPGMNLVGISAGVAVVTNRWESGGPGRVAPVRDVVEAVDRRTGASRWTRPVPADVLLGWGTDVVVELDPDGKLRVSDITTGELRRESRIVLTARPFYVSVDDGLARVGQQLPGGDPADQIVVSYDLATGAEHRREDPLRFSECIGRYRCRTDSGLLTVTDAASGAVRYSGPGDRYVLRGDRLIVTADAGGTRVHDLRTGRRLYALPGWIYADADQEGNLMVQPLAGSGLLVAALDETTGRLTVLGRTTDWSGIAYCLRGVRHVGCAGTSGVRIWRPDR
jgi:hypothetical protein